MFVTKQCQKCQLRWFNTVFNAVMTKINQFFQMKNGIFKHFLCFPTTVMGDYYKVLFSTLLLSQDTTLKQVFGEINGIFNT